MRQKGYGCPVVRQGRVKTRGIKFDVITTFFTVTELSSLAETVPDFPL